jgi:hypothetical protein
LSGDDSGYSSAKDAGRDQTDGRAIDVGGDRFGLDIGQDSNGMDASRPDAFPDARPTSDIAGDQSVSDTVARDSNTSKDVVDTPDAAEDSTILDAPPRDVDGGADISGQADAHNDSEDGDTGISVEDARQDRSDAVVLRTLENARANANTNLFSLDNTGFWSGNDIGAQSFVAPTNSLLTGQMLLYMHGTNQSPEVQFEIFPANTNGDIDISQPIFTGPKFTIPAGTNSPPNAAFFPLGNPSPISLVGGRVYFFTVSVRRNTVSPANAVMGPGSDAYGSDRFPGHTNLVSTSGSVLRQQDSLDLIFSLTFEE